MKTKNIIEGILDEKVDKLTYIKNIKCFRVEFNDNREDFYINIPNKKFKNLDINRQVRAYKYAK